MILQLRGFCIKIHASFPEKFLKILIIISALSHNVKVLDLSLIFPQTEWSLFWAKIYPPSKFH